MKGCVQRMLWGRERSVRYLPPLGVAEPNAGLMSVSGGDSQTSGSSNAQPVMNY